MSRYGYLCPYCGGYNAKTDTHCGRCNKRLPGEGTAGLIRGFLSVELLGAKVLGGLCIVVYVLEILASGNAVTQNPLGALFAGIPASAFIYLGGIAPGLVAAEPWRLLSACFVHLSLLHLGMNMLGLADLARVGEKHVGTPRFVITYVVTGILGFLASHWYYKGMTFTAGASGAIFGINGMILGGMAVRRDAGWKGMMLRAVLFSVAFGFMMPINQAAHFGGLFSGAAMGAAFELDRRPWRFPRAMAAMTAVCFAISLMSVILSVRSPAHARYRELERRAKDPVILPDLRDVDDD